MLTQSNHSRPWELSRRLRIPPSLLAAILILFCAANLRAQNTDAAANDAPAWRGMHHRHFPNTHNGIFPYSDQFETDNLTPAQLQFAATHYVGTQKITLAGAQALRQYNPDFLIMHYRLGEELGYGSCDQDGNPTANNPLQIIDKTWVTEWPGDSVVQPDWFYQYAGSPRVYDCGDQHFLMNLDDPGWRAWYSQSVIQQLTDNEDDAVFADSFSVPNYLGASIWNPNLPVLDPAFENAWSVSIHNFTDYMRHRFHHRWLWIPNVGSWITSRDATDYTNVDGVMIEDFAEYGNENYLATSDWQLQMNRALSLINLDKILIGQAYPAPWHSAAGERLFVLGSYLLVKGRHTYVNLDAQGGALTGSILQWWPEYSIDLGPPIDPLPKDISAYWNAQWGVYVRHYRHGMVLVNPVNAADGVSPTPITLDRTYYQVVNDSGGGVVPADGSAPGTLTYQAVKGLTVCNDCAAILLDRQP